MLRKRWREWQARRRVEDAREAEAIQGTTLAIVHQIADPLVTEGLATLRWPELWLEPGVIDKSRVCASIEPVREGAAAVSVEPGLSWIDVAIGEPFPGGENHELLTIEGWEEKLRECLDSVINGREPYGTSYRPYRSLGEDKLDHLPDQESDPA